MKIHLNTPTNTLTIPQMRNIVEWTIVWSNKNIGTKRKRIPMTFKITRSKIYHTPAYGVYDRHKNVIKINPDICGDVKNLISVTLHEYTHFLQDLRSYDKILDMVGYKKHPHEVEARKSEKLYSKCYREIKQYI